jgi:oxygen-dependent protoporphyrinogen oxidase
VSGIYTADPEKLSMAATMPEFLDLERRNGSLLRVPGFFGSRSRSVAMAGRSNAADSASGARYSFFVAPKHGMASLIRAVGARLPAGAIHINSPAKAVRQLPGGGWHVDFGAGETSRNPQSAMQNQRMQVDAVILAVPAFAAARLVSDFAPELSAELASIEYAGSAVVSLGYRRDQIARPLDGFGFVVPQTERRRIIAGSFASEKFAGRAPANCALIRVFIGGALQSELLERTDGDLLQTAVEELRDLLGIGGEALLSDVARWPRAMPQYHVGHLERVARIEQLAARYANFALAGNAYHGVGIPQCIASAEAAAEKIAARFTELPVTLGGGG